MELGRTEGKAVLVTTEHRGVFFGYLIGEPTKEKVRLSRCRNCIKWDTGIKGFLGLACTGPGPECRIGPAAPEIILYDITAVVTAAPEAVERWEKAPWA